MKQILAFLVITSLAFVSAFAQPKLDVRTLPTPSKNISRTIVTTPNVSPGASGAGVVWDFRNLMGTGQEKQQYLSRSELPDSIRAQYPLAQVGVLADTTLTLFRAVGRYFQILGITTPRTQMTVVVDPYDTRPTEIVYTGQLLDAYKATLRVNATPQLVGSRLGQHSVRYDGFGTLILPKNQYQEVARLTILGNTTDSFTISGANVVIKATTRRTTFQRVTDDTILLDIAETLTSITRNGQPVGSPITTTAVTHVGFEQTTSVGNSESEHTALALPNPSNGKDLTISGIYGEEVLHADVYSIAGSRVDHVRWQIKSTQSIAVSLPAVSSGRYLAVIETISGAIKIIPFVVVP